MNSTQHSSKGALRTSHAGNERNFKQNTHSVILYHGMASMAINSMASMATSWVCYDIKVCGTHTKVEVSERVGRVLNNPVPLLPQEVRPRQRRRIPVQLLKRTRRERRDPDGYTEKKKKKVHQWIFLAPDRGGTLKPSEKY